MTDQQTFRVRPGVLLSVIAFLLIAAPASATHFRYGHITWTPRPDIDPNAVDFTVQNVWRRDAYSTSNGRCINPATLASTACTGPGGFAGVGDLIREQQGTPRLDPGDGSALIGGPPSLAGALLYQVTAIDAGNNWAFGVAVDPVDLAGGVVDTDITHIYPGPGNYTAEIDDCCRVSACVSPTAHMNNPDAAFRVATIVNVTTPAVNSSPVSALPPIILCPIDGLCEFTVPASDNELDPLTFRLATPAEAGLTVQPGAPQCLDAATVDASTGLYSWDTSGCRVAGDPTPQPPNGGCNQPAFNTCYSTQVIVEENTTGGSRTALDFFICLVQCPPGNTAPTFDTPPTPVCGQTVSVAPGNTATFTVRASDAESAVELNATGVPGTATLTPGLPSSGNPVSTTFQWTPTMGDLGQHVVTFTATDQCTPTLCDITIDVSLEDCDDGADNDGDLLADCADPDCDGVACNDGAFCTINDSCRMGGCGGDPNPCDDGNACTTDTCSAGACANPPKASGTSCDDDGDACTVDRCNGAGACVQQSVVSCPGPAACDGGQSCNPATGLCQNDPDPPAGTPCTDNDGNVCTIAGCNGAGSCNQSQAFQPPSTPCEADGSLCTNDRCNGAGSCALVSTVSCPPAVPPCEAGEACNPGTGLCAPLADAPAGTSCNADGNLCTVDRCNGTGGCVFASNVACQPASPPCEAGATCNPGTGVCVPLPDAPNGTVCEADGSLCTNDRCNGTGSCVFSSSVTCQPASPPCEGGAACNPATGSCQPQADGSAGTPCADTDGNTCTTAACNGTGTCNQTHALSPAGTSCPDSDGTVCTTAACNGAGGCNQSHSVVSCPGATACAGGQTCNPGSGQCESAPDPAAGTPCADTDGAPCTSAACDGAGACDQSFTLRPADSPCEEDGNLCTTDRCDGAGTCTVGAAVVCQSADGQCDGGEACNPATGGCDPLPDAPVGTPCDDGRRCLINETCDGFGECRLADLSPECLGGFKCYKTVQINPSFGKLTVDLVDTFVTTNADVKKPRRVCNPTNIGGEGFAGDSTAHMMCYRIKEPRFTATPIIAEDRFGQQTLAVNTTESLCLPAEMAQCDGVGGQCDDPTPSDLEINHLKCYTVYELKSCLGGFNDGVPCIDDSECESGVCSVKEFDPVELSVVDAFETKATRIRRPKMLCTPVEKNAEPDSVVDPDKNLLCYKIKDVRGQPKFQREFFQTVDQFGEIDPLRAVRGGGLKASLLCVSAFIRPL